MSRRTRARRRGGFTLIELMVALVVGGIFVGSVYAVAKASTRHFYQQYGVAQMQASLRYAINQVKKDISKAGLFASPNAGLLTLQNECGAPPGNIHAPLGSGAIAGISAFTDDCRSQPECNGAGFLERTANMVQADTLVLLGAYPTASEYPVARALLTSRNQVAVEQQWHAFQRDFTTWFHSAGQGSGAGTMGGLSQGLLNQAFMPGRLVALRTMAGGMHFSTISLGGVVIPAGPTDPVLVPLDNAIPQSCNVSGGWISPLSFIRYVVENVPAGTASSERYGTMLGNSLQLIRREVRPDDKTSSLSPNCSIAGAPCTPDRVVLDYVVDFNVDFLIATATTPSVEDIVPLNAITTRTLAPGAVQATPELVRSVFVNIAVRSPEVDTKLRHLPLGGKTNMWDPLLTYYEPIPGMPTSAPEWRAARVRSMTAEIFVPNVAYAGQ
jgi:prepilin-type N-terminal cleavage/methylation domain-containing protein